MSITSILNDRATALTDQWHGQVVAVANELRRQANEEFHNCGDSSTARLKTPASVVRVIEAFSREEGGKLYYDIGDEFAEDVKRELHQLTRRRNVLVELRQTGWGFGRGLFVATNL